MTLRWWIGRNPCAFCEGRLREDAVRVGRRRFCSDRHAEKYRIERALARTRRSLGASGGAGYCK